jgi:hypoxanthine phosphoribosyltransferase
MLGDVVVPATVIEATVDRLASEIGDRVETTPTRPVFIGVLKGCVYFFSDLTRRIDRPLEMDFIQVSSYGKSTQSSGSVVLVKDISIDVRDRDVYLVEDIVDTGYTLRDLVQLLKARHPRSVRVVALLSKPARREVDVEVDHLGIEIEDRFVVGYGLDFDQQYRNLPEIVEYVPQ